MLGLVWRVGRSGGTFGSFPSKVNSHLWLLFFSLYKPIGREEKEKFCTLLLPSRFFSSSLPSSSPSILLAENFCNSSFFLLSRLVFLSFLEFFTCFSCLNERLLLWVVKICKGVALSWIYVHLMWKIKSLQLFSGLYERIE